MAAKNNNIKIGIFVLLAIALLVAGLLAFGAKSYFTKKIYFETAIVGEVSGLSVGSGVQYRGVPVGKVTKITFAWDQYPASKTNYIIVDFEIESETFPLPKGMDMKAAVKQATERGLRAVVKSQGITGTSLLAVQSMIPPPPAPVIDYTPDFIYIPSMPGQLTRLVESVEKSLDNLQRLDFASIGAGVTNALDDVHRLSAKLDKLDLEAISTNANGVLLEVKTMAVKLEDTVGQVQETIKGMKLDTIGQNAGGLITELRQSNVKLQTVLTKLGSVPMQDTVVDLQQTMQTLDDVLLELKRYPAGFFLGDPPLPAKGMQRVRDLK